MTADELDYLKRKIEALESRVSQLEQLPVPVQNIILEKKLSLREFIISKKPASEIRVGLLIVYFLEKYEGKQSFTVKDIAEGFRLAKESKPTNLSDVIQKNAKKGYFDEVGRDRGVKSWVLTNSGISEAEK
jgi:hypothetical protein